MGDGRLAENEVCLTWFRKWEQEVKDNNTLPLSERNKLLLSEKTMFDIYSMVIGFQQLCTIVISWNNEGTLLLGCCNSDGQKTTTTKITQVL